VNSFNLSTNELVEAFEETSFSQPLQLIYDYEDSLYVYVVEK